MAKRNLTPSEVKLLQYKGRGRRPGQGLATRAKILESAAEIIRKEGTDHLTIDGIISKAGVSKGAYLYHFPKRIDLVAALSEEIAYLRRETEEEVEYIKKDTSDPVLAGFIKWHEDTMSGRARESLSTIMGLALGDRKNYRAMHPIKDWYAEHFQKLANSKAGAANAMVVALTLDAIEMHSILGTNSMNHKQTEEVLELLAKIAGLTPEDLKREAKFSASIDAPSKEERKLRRKTTPLRAIDKFRSDWLAKNGNK